MNELSVVEVIDVYIAAYKKGHTQKQIETQLLEKGVKASTLKEAKKSIHRLGLLIDKAPKDHYASFQAASIRRRNKIVPVVFCISVFLLLLSFTGWIDYQGPLFYISTTFSGGYILVRNNGIKRRFIRRKFD